MFGPGFEVGCDLATAWNTWGFEYGPVRKLCSKNIGNHQAGFAAAHNLLDRV